MQRQGIGPDASGAGKRDAGGGIVAPAQVQRIETEPVRRIVDQHFRHRHGDRLADPAIGAGRRFVLGQHLRGHADPAGGVCAADQGRGESSVPGAAARIDRIGAGAHRHFRFESLQAAVCTGYQPSVDGELPGMDIGQEGLQPVRGPSDRPAEQARGRNNGQLVGIGVQLQAERAADIGADDPHPVQRQAEQVGPDILHLVRRLAGLEYRQRSFRPVIVGQHGAALQRHAGLALEPEAPPRRAGRLCRTAEIALQHNVAIRRRVGVAVPGGRIVVMRRRPVLDLQQDGLDRVTRPVERVRDGQRDRLALIMDAGFGQRRLRRRPVFRDRGRARDHRPANRPEIDRGQDRGDAGYCARRGDIQVDDPAVGDRAAQEGGVQHARQRQVAGEPAAPGDQPARLAARNRSVGVVGH